MLRTRHPDIVLLDLTVPEMDGFRVLEEKRCAPTIRDPSGDLIISDTFTLTGE